MNIIDYLKYVIADDKYIEWIHDEFYNNIKSDIIYVDEYLLLEITSKLHEKKERDIFWETILDYLPPESIFQSIFDYLIKNKIGITSLAHMELDDKMMKMLAQYEEEALFFLAKKYYTSEKYSIDILCDLLVKYNNENLLEQLLFHEPNDYQKLHVLYYFNYENNQYQQKVKTLMKAERLKATENIQELKAAYKLNDYLLNLSLSKNLFTPDEILEEMTKISNIKFASKIRNNSQETRKIKKLLKV